MWFESIKMKSTITKFLLFLLAFYLLMCASLYFSQESFIFHPKKLSDDYRFDFPFSFEERFFQTKNGTSLNGMLFRSNGSNGLIFFLHGNSGSLDSWGYVAPDYTQLGYDVFMLDYRGYGKSQGSISSQEQIFEDVQIVYNDLKNQYDEDNIVVIGYSIGTGIAAKLASDNNPRALVLEAPYFELAEVMKQRFSFVPAIILKYKLTTNEYLSRCRMPVFIFHGDQDEVIDYESSLKLAEKFKSEDTLVRLSGQGHTGIERHADFIPTLRDLLERH